jgi:hypothetical protein
MPMLFDLPIPALQTTFRFDVGGAWEGCLKAFFGDQLRPKSATDQAVYTVRLRHPISGRGVTLADRGDAGCTVNMPLRSLLRAALRSTAQVALPQSNSIGLFEAFVGVLRLGFFEPLEAIAAERGFALLHAATLAMPSGEALLLVAPTKGGKSTVAATLAGRGFALHGDNYAFFDGTTVFTVPECRRLGPPRRLSPSFYAKGVNPPPTPCQLPVASVVVLAFGEAFCTRPTDAAETAAAMATCYQDSGEGVMADQAQRIESAFLTLVPALENLHTFRLEMMRDLPRTEAFLEQLVDDQMFGRRSP